MNNYCNLEEVKEHAKIQISWLIEEVLSAGGDGDGIWYSKYYKTSDILEFMKKEDLLPSYWKVIWEDDKAFSVGAHQECLIVTNRGKDFDERPIWQQVSLVW